MSSPSSEHAPKEVTALVDQTPDWQASEESAPESPSRRLLLKLLAAGLSGAGAAQLLAPSPPAQAAYLPGGPSDTVDTSLSVQGNLVVDGSVGIGTSITQGRLDVAGELRSANALVIGSDARAKQCYYVPGPGVTPLPTTTAGSWGRAKSVTWASLGAGTWDQARTIDGSWDHAFGYSWTALSTSSWDSLMTGVLD